MRYLLIIMAAGLMVFSGCEVDRAPTERPASLVYPPFELETQSLNRETGNCETDTSRTCTKVAMLYQTVKDTSRTEAVKAINTEIVQGIKGVIGYDSTTDPSLQEMAALFIDDYEQLHKDFPDAMGWYMNVSGEVVRNDSAFLVIRIQSESYTGGAHGVHNFQFMNFNPINGETVALEDIFIEGFEEPLNRLALNAFRDARNLAPNTDPRAEGFSFYNDRYYNPDNFAVLKDEILFYFNYYEIAPYSAGPTTISIPLEDLEDLLN
jgi:hypothetical protein